MSVDSEPRRSTRRSNRVVYTDHDDDVINDEEISGSEASAEDDDDYEVITKKRKVNHRTSSKTKRHNNKPRNKLGKKIASTMEDMGEDFVENPLYKSLCNPEVSLDELVLEWIDQYVIDEVNGDNIAITSLINLILRCCGCIHLFQPHDLVNLESSHETIGELVIAFQHQKHHEYPFISNNKDLKFFKHNVLEFFEKFINLCHTKELLYVKLADSSTIEVGESLSSSLMNKVSTWLLSLTTCSIRPIRYVSTTILMMMQTELCIIANDLSSSIDKTQSQLANNKKSKRNKQERIAVIDNNLKTLNHQKSTIIEYLNDITETAFVHRYRDVDPLIRQECITSLGNWMINFPEYFVQSTYLRYFGWLLSDPNNHVRLETVKSLLKLYKLTNQEKQTMSPEFRQFTLRFKDQMINMCYKDNDCLVRINVISLLSELVKLVYITYQESISIISNFLQLINLGSSFSKVNNDKLKSEYSKFVNVVNIEQIKQLRDENEDALLSNNDLPININECLKMKCLIDILQEAASLPTDKISRDNGKIDEIYSASTIFNHLYQLSYYNKSWLFLIDYFLFDISSLEINADTSNELKNKLELNNSDKSILLQFLHGSLSYIISKKKVDNDIDDPKELSNKLIEKLSPMLTQSIKSSNTFEIFLKIWILVLTKFNELQNIYSTFQSSNKVELYEKLNKSIFQNYKDYNQDLDNQLMKNFEEYFNVFLSNYNDSASNITSEIRNEIDEVLQSLTNESVSIINEINFYEEEGESIQNSIIEHTQLVSYNLEKINKLGNYIDINRFIEDSNTTSLPLIDLIKMKIFDKLNLEIYFPNITSDMLVKLSNINQSFTIILDQILIVISSKLEKLIGSNIPSEFDINSLFDDYNPIVESILKIFNDSERCTSSLNDSIGSSSLSISVEETQNIINKFNDFRTILITKIMDFIVSLRVFYDKFNTGSNHFRNFHEFFNNSKILSILVNSIPLELQNKILNLFLIKETKLSKLLNIDLTRNDDENINLTTEMEIDEYKISNQFNSDDEDGEDEETDDDAKNYKIQLKELKIRSKKQREIWDLEKKLCVYTVKLFSLINLGLIDKFILDRIKLNKDKIGGLFSKIVEQHDNDLTKNRDGSPISNTGETFNDISGNNTNISIDIDVNFTDSNMQEHDSIN